MAVSFLASDLAKWDLLEQGPEWLALPFFVDERPLRGAAGLCDWRLCGRLSRLLSSGRVSGAWGETTLYPPNSGGAKRLPFGGLILFGLGAADGFDEARAREAAQIVHAKMAKLGVARYALVAPGRSTGRLSARRALEIFLAEAVDPGPDLVVIESLAGQKEAAELTRAR
jgi:hypothetical protein